jgi:hypothetical protein
MTTILVQMADKVWTKAAMHLACALARNTGATVIVLQLFQVRHVSYLGTDFGNISPNERDCQDLREIAATAEEYGIEITVQPMQCLSSLDALAQAVHYLKADVVFARIVETRIPLWRKFQVWNLERLLRGTDCQLFTVDRPRESSFWTPSITVKTAVPRD